MPMARCILFPAVQAAFGRSRTNGAWPNWKRAVRSIASCLAQVEVLRSKQRLAVFEEEAKEPPLLYLTEKDLLGTKEHRVKRYCSECGEALWQSVSIKAPDWHPSSVLDLKKEIIPPLPLPERDHKPPCLTNTFRRRYPMGDYLLNRYKHVFHLLIADEVHEGSDGTALDFARQRLASACGRM